jgi:hypothetical protein
MIIQFDWPIVSQRFYSDLSSQLDESELEDLWRRIMFSKWENKVRFSFSPSRTRWLNNRCFRCFSVCDFLRGNPSLSSLISSRFMRVPWETWLIFSSVWSFFSRSLQVLLSHQTAKKNNSVCSVGSLTRIERKNNILPLFTFLPLWVLFGSISL